MGSGRLRAATVGCRKWEWNGFRERDGLSDTVREVIGVSGGGYVMGRGIMEMWVWT